MEEDAGGGAEMLEFSMVIFMYDRLCGAGVCWLAELACCELRESNVEAGAKGVRNAKLDFLVSLSKRHAEKQHIP